MKVFVDIDGTLIDHNDNFRPFVIPFLHRIKSLEYNLIVWSGGGKDYAEHHIRRLGPHLYSLVDKFATKIGNSNARPLFKPGDNKLFFVDDSEYLIHHMRQTGYGVYRTATYDATIMTNDVELMRALQAMEDYERG